MKQKGKYIYIFFFPPETFTKETITNSLLYPFPKFQYNIGTYIFSLIQMGAPLHFAFFFNLITFLDKFQFNPSGHTTFSIE